MKEAYSSFNQALRASISWSQYAELINLGCNYSYNLAELILWNMRHLYINLYFLEIEYNMYYGGTFLHISVTLFFKSITYSSSILYYYS